MMPPKGSTSYMKLFEEAWHHYGESDMPRPIKPFEYEHNPDDMLLAKQKEGQKGQGSQKSVLEMVNPGVAPGNAEEAPWDGLVGDPTKTVSQGRSSEDPMTDEDSSLDALDRCILASENRMQHFPKDIHQPAKSTESFKRGAVPGFQSAPGKRQKVDTIPFPVMIPTPPQEIPKGQEGETTPLNKEEGASIPPTTGHSQDSDEATVQVVEVHVARKHAAIQLVLTPKGNTYGNLRQAETQLLHGIQTTLTNAVGQVVLDKDEIQHGDMICCNEDSQSPVGMPCLANDKRDILLWQQKGWVAWDEMDFYRNMIEQTAKGTTHEGLVLQDSPATATDWALWIVQVAKTLYPNQVEKCSSFVLWKQHWIPVGVTYAGENGEALSITTTTEGVKLFQKWAREAWLSDAEDVHWATVDCEQVFQHDCGFQSIAWIKAFVQNVGVKSVSGYEACQQRAEFHRFLEAENLAQVFVSSPLNMGGMTTCEEKLSQLLYEHGVAKLRTAECASHLVQVLGKGVIQQILTSAKPWADLKTRASMARPPIRIVLAEELQATIDKRTKEGNHVGRKSNKGKNKTKTDESFKLRADQIHIPTAVFCQADGSELEQISACSIGSETKGVVVANIDEALPYFRLQKPMSSEGIALLILDFEDERIPEQKELIKVPAICLATQEPVLLQVAMLQIGSKPVGRNVPSQCLQIQEVANCVVRAMVYKDQYPGDWQEFVKHPVRHIMQNPTFAQHQQEILDVWDRQFLSIRMTKTPQAESVIFVVCIRVQSSVAESLCQISGSDGLYCEPRSTTGRQPDSAFQVIWLPKKSFGEAQLAARTSQVKTTLARSGDRYGLRVENEHAAVVHQIHRPEVMFIKGTELKKFRVGPLPYGSTRQSIANVFRKWEWEARPLGPYAQSKDRTGMIWTAQAATPPENLVYQLAHGDVLITPEAPVITVPNQQAATVVASDKTMQCLKQSSQKDEKRDEKKTGNDPWLHYDPWQSSGKPGKEVSVAQFAAMQAKIEAAVDQKLQKITADEPMTGATDSRVSTLEKQVQDLASSVHNFQSQQVHQNQRLAAQIQSVDQKVEHQQQSLHQMLDSKLEDQMARIEQLFTKRARME